MTAVAIEVASAAPVASAAASVLVTEATGRASYTAPSILGDGLGAVAIEKSASKVAVAVVEVEVRRAG